MTQPPDRDVGWRAQSPGCWRYWCMAQDHGYELTRRLLRVLARAPLDSVGEAEYGKILNEMAEGPLPFVLARWALTLYPTAPSGAEATRYLRESYPHRAWPALAARLIDAAAQGPHAIAGVVEAIMVELDDRQINELIWELVWLYKQVVDDAGGYTLLTEIVEAHGAWAVDQDNPAIGPAALIVATIAAGNVAPADRYLAALMLQGPQAIGRLVEIWCAGAAALLTAPTMIMEVDEHGIPQSLGTNPADTSGDTQGTLALAVDLIASARGAATPPVQELRGRYAALSPVETLLLARHLALTVGVRLGQVTAEIASTDGSD
jgi:hypothetical protein